MSNETERFQNIEIRLDESTGTPLWLQRNYTEPRVNYAMKDLVKPGMVAFDVGANFGGLSVTLSRLVGPRGVVCAFEANPVIAAKCQRELQRSGAFNTQLYHGAVYKKSGESIELFLSDNQVADSIYRKTDRSVKVPTLTLDDFVANTNLAPQLVKMDIEGAEADALLGFERTIDRVKPVFILEHTPPDNTCFNFLVSKGYQAIDLQNYKRLSSGDDVQAGTVVTDILYAQPHHLVGTAYEQDLVARPHTTLTKDDFNWVSENNYRSISMDLPPGRYLAHLNFKATGTSNTMCGLWQESDNAAIMRVHASSAGLVVFAQDIVFEIEWAPVHVFFHFLDHRDETFDLESVSISKIDAFDTFRAPFSVTM